MNSTMPPHDPVVPCDTGKSSAEKKIPKKGVSLSSMCAKTRWHACSCALRFFASKSWLGIWNAQKPWVFEDFKACGLLNTESNRHGAIRKKGVEFCCLFSLGMPLMQGGCLLVKVSGRQHVFQSQLHSRHMMFGMCRELMDGCFISDCKRYA